MPSYQLDRLPGTTGLGTSPRIENSQVSDSANGEMDKRGTNGESRYTAGTRALQPFTLVCYFPWKTPSCRVALIWRSGFSRLWSMHSSRTSSYGGNYSADSFSSVCISFFL